jgi:hypothetical protein
MSDTPEVDEPKAPRASVRREHVRMVRVGHGANCSSIGSVVDTLFVGAAVGGAIFAAILAAMRDEPIRVLTPPGNADTQPASDAKDDAS